MYNTTVLDFMPLWAVFIASAILIVIAIETGFWLGQRKMAQLGNDESAHVGGAVAATIGLLAFMLAFTFSSGASRWDTRKELLLQESNAIGTAFLRTDLLPEPQRSRSRQLLAEYVDEHLSISEDRNHLSGRNATIEMSELIARYSSEGKKYHDQLWREAISAAQQQPTPTTALYVAAVNDLIDLLQARVTVTVQQRMPGIFWFMLFLLALLAMGLAGYDAGVSRSARSYMGVVVAMAFSAVIVLVIALDRPQTSAIRQLPMLELQADMQATMEGERDSPP